MSHENNTTIKSFLNQIKKFTNQDNIIENPCPSKRRDIREVYSSINQLFQNSSKLQIDENNKSKYKTDKALHNINIALSDVNAIIDSKIDSEYAIQTIASYANIYYFFNDFPTAIEIYNQIFDLSKKTDNIKFKAYSKFKIAEIYVEEYRLESAKIYLEESKQFYCSIKDYQGEMKCWYSLGIIYHKKGDYFSAYNCYEKAYKLAEVTSELKKEAYIANHLGTISRIIGEKENSEYLFNNALKIFIEINDYVGQIESLNNLAMIFLQKSNYQQALTNLNESIEICEKVENYHLLNFINLNKAHFYLEVGDPRNAAKFCSKAIEIMTISKKTIGLAKACRIYGSIFKNYDQYDIATQFYEESLKLYKEFEIPLGFANCCSEYGELLLDTDKVSDAVKHFNIAMDIYKELELYDCAEKLEETLNSPKFAAKLETVPEPIITQTSI